jgi:hypothetical protein
LARDAGLLDRSRRPGTVDDMKRRAFVAALAAGLVVPAWGPAAGKVYRVGVLSAPLAARPHQWEALRQGMRDHGYLLGQNRAGIQSAGGNDAWVCWPS